MNPDRIATILDTRHDSLAWAKESHSVVKYNPIYFCSNGLYQKQEWTSMWDIGKTFDGYVFSREEYLQMETRYVNTALKILEASGCKYLTIFYYKGFYNSLESLRESPLMDDDIYLFKRAGYFESGSRISLNRVDPLLRLNLRDWSTFFFLNIKNNVQLDIGYDYYMHIHAPLPVNEMKKLVSNEGLFLDPW